MTHTHKHTHKHTHTRHALISNGADRNLHNEEFKDCKLHWIIIRCNETWENKSNRAFNLHEEDISTQDFGEVV